MASSPRRRAARSGPYRGPCGIGSRCSLAGTSGHTRRTRIAGQEVASPTLGSALPCPAGRSGPWSRRTGAPQASATGRDRTLGPCWVRAAPGPKGLGESPAVTTGQHESQVDGYPTPAAGMRRAGRSDCGPEGHRPLRQQCSRVGRRVCWRLGSSAVDIPARRPP